MRISSNFDSGNIEVVSLNSRNDIRLEIKKDSNSEFLQWFHFRLQTERNSSHTIKITNAGKCSYPEAWKGYRACASYDRKNWFRVPTDFDGENLIIRHSPEHESVYYAYFVPYSYERHEELIGWAQASPDCRVENLCDTVDNRDLNLLVVGEEAEHKKKVWIIARQHPGESMAEWYMEGLVHRILDPHDSISRELLKKAVFYLVPNMNPDGSFRGNLRSNAAGANLNREWQEPSIDRSPEVYWVRKKMHETGVDMAMDIHGDEELPYNFIAACEGIPSYNERLQNLEEKFTDHLISINPDFQKEKGYERDNPGEANLTLATTYIGETFNCLSMTLEMPFKDNANSPDEHYGWSPARAKRLGKSSLNSIYYILDQL